MCRSGWDRNSVAVLCIPVKSTRTPLKIRSIQDNRGAVGVRVAGHLAQNPVAAISVGQYYSRAKFGLR